MARSLRQCVLAGHGLTGPAIHEAEALLQLHENIAAFQDAALRGNTAAASRAANLKSVDFFRDRRARERLQQMLQIARTAEALDNIRLHPKDIGNGIQALLGFDIHQVMNGVDNVETLSKAISDTAFRIASDFIIKFRAKGLNLKHNLDDIDELLTGLFDALNGKKVPGDLGGIIEGFLAMNRYLTAEYRRVGGNLPERNGWFPNPLHSRSKIAWAADVPDPRLGIVRAFKRRKPTDADRRVWMDATRPLLDRDQMIDFETGLPLTDTKLDEVLTTVWETLSSGGTSKIEPGVRGGNKLANSRGDPRILHFKDAESWKIYNEQFGEGNIVESIVRHVESMSRDIALMRVLGPNPDQTMRVLIDTARKENIGFNKRRHITQQYRIIARKVGVGSEEMANAGQNMRNLLVAHDLGSASLTALGDIGFTKATAEFNNMSVMKIYRTYMKSWVSSETQANFAKQGIIVDGVLGAASASERFMDAISAGGATGQIADKVLRVTGLVDMTNNMRAAFAQIFNGEIWDKLKAHPTFAGLERNDPVFHRTLARYGITEEDWTLMGRSNPLPLQGENFFQPAHLNDIKGVDFNTASDLAERIRGMIIQEQDFAVPTSNSRVNALLGGGLERGTIPGEAARFFAMYKRFPILVIHTHLMRALSAPGQTTAGRFGYAAKVMVYTTVLGAVALQMKSFSSGRGFIDPTETTKSGATFLTRAALQGGALGIWGDILFTDTSGFGRSWMTGLAGPAVGVIDATKNLTVGTIQGVASLAVGGKFGPDLGRSMVQFLDSIVPGTRIWYLRLAWDRLIIDTMLELADPDYARKRNKRRQKANDDLGTRHFRLGPGDLSIF